ncbi:MAG: hypothetical protein JST39_19745 [Bacteroidetes bacterium]|nr:hypothetical protein [Bacteroidota bacterium]
MKKTNLPLLISTKEIQRITGWSERTTRKKMTQIRKLFLKPPRSPILLREFCQFFKCSAEDLLPFF